MNDEEIIDKVTNQILNTMIELNKELKFNSSKCIGIGGRLFGHRFKLNYADVSRATDFCTRCGYLPK